MFFSFFETIPQLGCLTYCFNLQGNKILRDFVIQKNSTDLGCGKSKQVKCLNDAANIEI